MTIDFFVHPEHACYEEGKYPDGEIYQRYRASLLGTLESSDFPILINGLAPEANFGWRIPKSNQLESASYFVGEYLIERGEISPQDWEKFKRLLSGYEGEELRIHGSNFGECTEGFAIQLFAYLIREEHWHDWGFNPDFEGKGVDFKKEWRLRMGHQKNGDFRNSNIRYGNVLRPLRKIDVKKPSWNRFSKFRHGNVTHQLVDDNSLVHGKL